MANGSEPYDIPCEVIGCKPYPSTVWLPDDGVFACLRCALELMALQRLATDAARQELKR